MNRIIVLAFVILCCSYQCSSETYATRLVLVTGMFRHGERTPDPEQMDPFPKYDRNAADKTEKFNLYGLGQLTKEGKETMYKLGEKLKKLYQRKFSQLGGLRNSDIKMESTTFTRCLASAQITLKGFYGEMDKEKVSEKDWTKDPHINSTARPDLEEIFKFYYKGKCEIYGTLLKKSLSKNIGKLGPCRNPMKLMREKLGVKNPNPLLVWYMSELYKGEKCAGVAPPKWLKEQVLTQMDKCVNKFLQLAFGTDDMKKQSGGIYVDMVLKEFNNYIEQPQGMRYKLHLISTHDSVLAPALAALGGPKGYLKKEKPFTVDVPTYGAAILVELHQESSGKYYIEVYYWNDGSENPTRLFIKGCDGSDKPHCYLEDYQKLQYYIRMAKEHLERCQMPISNKKIT